MKPSGSGGGGVPRYPDPNYTYLATIKPPPQTYDPKLDALSAEEKAITVLCEANGIVRSELAKSGPRTELLEVFQYPFKQILGLKHFPNLKTLELLNLGIERMDGGALEPCTKLERLWLIGSSIRRIGDSLQTCIRLRYVLGPPPDASVCMRCIVVLRWFWR